MISPIAIDIYTDGSSKGNPGNGGLAYIIRTNGIMYKFAQGELTATNNRMELSAAIAAFNAIKNIVIDNKLQYIINVYSDSQYITEAINKNWLFNWVRRGFLNVKNSDLWSQFFLLVSPLMLQTNVKVNFIWIKGHNGNKYNEIVDKLAKSACGKQGIITNYYFNEKTTEC
jgi:ribonuclease HI